jgi:hypothetical protein
MKLHLALTSFIAVSFTGTLAAQETSKFTFDLGAGFTTTVGSTGKNLDTAGWNLRGGAGYNFSPHFGALVNLGYDSFGINSGTLNALGFPGGDVHIFTAMIDPIYHVTPKGRFDFYVTGGGGLFHQSQEFTQPSAATLVGYNPFFGFVNATIPTTQVLSSYSVNKPGYDVGAGVALGTKWHGKFFAEAKYYHMFDSNTHTDFIPVTFGYRW